MQKPQTFGQCLRGILNVHGMSASKLSVQMGFNSRNSLFRLLNDETSYERQRAFLKALSEQNALSLTAEERERLVQSMEIGRLGQERYLCDMAMDRLLMRKPFETRSITVVLNEREGIERRMSLAELFAQLFAGQAVELVLCNFGFGVFFETLAAALHAANAMERTVIRHFFDAQDSKLVQMIAAIRPVLHLPCYQAYSLNEHAAQEVHGLYAAHMLLAKVRTASGERCCQFILTDRERMDGFLLDESAAYDKRFFWLMNLLHAHGDDMRAVKSEFARATEPADYLRYTEQYCALEQGCRLYTLKRDVPINFIHPNILLGSVMDGFRETGFANGQDLSDLVSQFYEIHLRRWNNFFENRKVTHTIFTYETMRRFAQTGRQSDHFFAMRAYTPEERVAILTNLKEQTDRNPYFNIYFFKKDRPSPVEELGLYEGKGVLLTKACTDYRLDGDHSETLISEQAFCAQFKEHFLQKLLAQDVTDSRETQYLMKELIDLAGEESL